jgi:hypothetical protein
MEAFSHESAFPQMYLRLLQLDHSGTAGRTYMLPNKLSLKPFFF